MARILVIDDDRDVRTLVLYELDIHAREGRNRNHLRPDAEFPQVKIIAISGGGRLAVPARRAFTDHDLGVVTEQLGVAAVLRKPFATKELLRSIESVLGEH